MKSTSLHTKNTRTRERARQRHTHAHTRTRTHMYTRVSCARAFASREEHLFQFPCSCSGDRNYGKSQRSFSISSRPLAPSAEMAPLPSSHTSGAAGTSAVPSSHGILKAPPPCVGSEGIPKLLLAMASTLFFTSSSCNASMCLSRSARVIPHGRSTGTSASAASLAARASAASM